MSTEVKDPREGIDSQGIRLGDLHPNTSKELEDLSKSLGRTKMQIMHGRALGNRAVGINEAFDTRTSFTENSQSSINRDWGNSSYDESLIGSTAEIDLASMRDDSQGYLASMGSAVGKFVNKTITTTGTTLGALLGGTTAAAMAIYEGKNWRDVLYDSINNSISKSFSQFDKYVDEQLFPIYRRKEETSAGLFSTNNIVSEGFLGQLGDLFGFTKGASLITGGFTSAMMKLGVGPRTAGLLASAFGATGEASIEAMHAEEEFTKAAHDRYYGELQQTLRDIDTDIFSSEEAKELSRNAAYEKYNQQVAKMEEATKMVGNFTFLGNMAVLTPSNFIAFAAPHIRGTKGYRYAKAQYDDAVNTLEESYKAGRITEEAYKKQKELLVKNKTAMMEGFMDAASQGVTTTASREGITAVNNLTKGKMYRTLAVRPFVEGWEEGSQMIMSETAKNNSINYIDNYWSTGETRSSLETIKDYFKEMADTTKNLVGDEQFWYESALGFLIGGLGTPNFKMGSNAGGKSKWRPGFEMEGSLYGEYKQLSERYAENEALVNEVNERFKGSTLFQNTLRNAKAMVEGEEEKNKALAEGDMAKYNAIELAQSIKNIIFASQRGILGSVREYYNAMKGITLQEVQAMINSETAQDENGKPKGPFVQADGTLMSAEEVMKDIRDAADSMLSQIAEYSDTAKLLSNIPGLDEDTKAELAYLMTTGNTMQKKYKELLNTKPENASQQPFSLETHSTAVSNYVTALKDILKNNIDSLSGDEKVLAEKASEILKFIEEHSTEEDFLEDINMILLTNNGINLFNSRVKWAKNMVKQGKKAEDFTNEGEKKRFLKYSQLEEFKGMNFSTGLMSVYSGSRAISNLLTVLKDKGLITDTNSLKATEDLKGTISEMDLLETSMYNINNRQNELLGDPAAAPALVQEQKAKAESNEEVSNVVSEARAIMTAEAQANNPIYYSSVQEFIDFLVEKLEEKGIDAATAKKYINADFLKSFGSGTNTLYHSLELTRQAKEYLESLKNWYQQQSAHLQTNKLTVEENTVLLFIETKIKEAEEALGTEQIFYLFDNTQGALALTTLSNTELREILKNSGADADFIQNASNAFNKMMQSFNEYLDNKTLALYIPASTATTPSGQDIIVTRNDGTTITIPAIIVKYYSNIEQLVKDNPSITQEALDKIAHFYNTLETSGITDIVDILEGTRIVLSTNGGLSLKFNTNDLTNAELLSFINTVFYGVPQNSDLVDIEVFPGYTVQISLGRVISSSGKLVGGLHSSLTPGNADYKNVLAEEISNYLNTDATTRNAIAKELRDRTGLNITYQTVEFGINGVKIKKLYIEDNGYSPIDVSDLTQNTYSPIIKKVSLKEGVSIPDGVTISSVTLELKDATAGEYQITQAGYIDPTQVTPVAPTSDSTKSALWEFDFSNGGQIDITRTSEEYIKNNPTYSEDKKNYLLAALKRLKTAEAFSYVSSGKLKKGDSIKFKWETVDGIKILFTYTIDAGGNEQLLNILDYDLMQTPGTLAYTLYHKIDNSKDSGIIEGYETEVKDIGAGSVPVSRQEISRDSLSPEEERALKEGTTRLAFKQGNGQIVSNKGNVKKEEISNWDYVQRSKQGQPFVLIYNPSLRKYTAFPVEMSIFSQNSPLWNDLLEKLKGGLKEVAEAIKEGNTNAEISLGAIIYDTLSPYIYISRDFEVKAVHNTNNKGNTYYGFTLSVDQLEIFNNSISTTEQRQNASYSPQASVEDTAHNMAEAILTYIANNNFLHAINKDGLIEERLNTTLSLVTSNITQFTYTNVPFSFVYLDPATGSKIDNPEAHINTQFSRSSNKSHTTSSVRNSFTQEFGDGIKFTLDMSEDSSTDYSVYFIQTVMGTSKSSEVTNRIFRHGLKEILLYIQKEGKIGEPHTTGSPGKNWKVTEERDSNGKIVAVNLSYSFNGRAINFKQHINEEGKIKEYTLEVNQDISGIQILVGEFRVEEPLTNEEKNAIDKIVEDSAQKGNITVVPGEATYTVTDENGNTFTVRRVTDLAVEGENYKESAPEVRASRLATGRAIDAVVRAYVNYLTSKGSEEKKLPEYVEDFFNTESGKKVKKEIDRLIEEYTKEGYKVYADGMFLYDKDLGIGGTTDLVFINETTGNVKIIDIKTTKKDPERPFYSIKGYHEKQLSWYKQLFSKMTGISIHAIDTYTMTFKIPNNDLLDGKNGLTTKELNDKNGNEGILGKILGVIEVQGLVEYQGKYKGLILMPYTQFRPIPNLGLKLPDGSSNPNSAGLTVDDMSKMPITPSQPNPASNPITPINSTSAASVSSNSPTAPQTSTLYSTAFTHGVAAYYIDNIPVRTTWNLITTPGPSTFLQVSSDGTVSLRPGLGSEEKGYLINNANSVPLIRKRGSGSYIVGIKPGKVTINGSTYTLEEPLTLILSHEPPRQAEGPSVSSSHISHGETDGKVGSTNGIDDMFRRTTDRYKHSPIDFAQELGWMERALPQFSMPERVQVINGTIRIVNDFDNPTEAWGLFTRGMMVITSTANRGTVYHEAFHAVFHLLLSQAERDALLKEVKSSNPELINDLMAEEFLADAFMEYGMTQENAGFIKRVTSKAKYFLSLFKNWGNVNMSMNILFYRMYNGMLSNRTPNREYYTLEEERAALLNKGENSDIIIVNGKMYIVTKAGHPTTDTQIYQEAPVFTADNLQVAESKESFDPLSQDAYVDGEGVIQLYPSGFDKLNSLSEGMEDVNQMIPGGIEIPGLSSADYLSLNSTLTENIKHCY